MFFVSIITTQVFIMDEEKNIFEATECDLTYKGNSLSFIERDGLYAYSEFFREGWSEYDKENGENESIRLQMIQGGWNESICNLVQSIDYVIDFEIEENHEQEIITFINRLKNIKIGKTAQTQRFGLFELKN